MKAWIIFILGFALIASILQFGISNAQTYGTNRTICFNVTTPFVPVPAPPGVQGKVPTPNISKSGSCIETSMSMFTTTYGTNAVGDGVWFNTSLTSLTTATPPTSVVLQYNNKTAQKIITCPVSPNPKNVKEYFISNTSTFVGGNRCFANSIPLETSITFVTTLAWTPYSKASIQSVTYNILHASDGGSIYNFGYSGEADYQLQNSAANVPTTNTISTNTITTNTISSNTISTGSATCPNVLYPAVGGTGGARLSFEQVVACAKNAGFSGTELIQIVSIAAAESSFTPGATGAGLTSSCTAQGILQEGQCQSPGEGYPEVTNYNPNSCSTYSQTAPSWSGVFYNPTCAFQLAYAYASHQPAITQSVPPCIVGAGVPFCNWGSYWVGGAYCQYAPTSYSGFNCPKGMNAACLPWNELGQASGGCTGGGFGTSGTTVGGTSDTGPVSPYNISSSYDTKSYIFGNTSSSVQQGIWTWNIKFANFSKANLTYLQGSGNIGNLTYYSQNYGATYIPPFTVIPFTYVCRYNYTYSWKTKVDYVKNVNIPVANSIFVANTEGIANYNDPFKIDYNKPQNVVYGQNVPVVPYILYETSMPASYSNINAGLNYLNMSFDVYSPHNYLQANAYIEPFPINGSSGILAGSNGGSGPSYLLEARNLTMLTGTGTNLQANSPIANLSYFITAYPSSVTSVSSYLDSPKTIGGLYASKINNPSFIISAPSGQVYVIEYSVAKGFNWLVYQSKTVTSKLFKLQSVPFGDFNLSALPPMSVSQAKATSTSSNPIGSSAFKSDLQNAEQKANNAWTAEWAKYWNNSLVEQSGNLYITNIRDAAIVKTSGGGWGWFENLFGISSQESLGGQFPFTPLGIATDYGGNLFLEGQDPSNHALDIGMVPANDLSAASWHQFSQFTKLIDPTEFAASPGGQYVYLASPYSGNIMVFQTQNWEFVGNISLAYSLYSLQLNIDKYMTDGGPYITNSIASEYGSNGQGLLDSVSNHHPLGIAESDGVLYVLDLWSFNEGTSGYYVCVPNFGIGCHNVLSKNRYTSILMVRAFTSNNSEAPINPFRLNDLANVQISTSNSQSVNSLAVNSVLNAGIATPIYPPFGWPISANITNQANYILSDKYITFCGFATLGSDYGCSYTPTDFNSISTKSSGALNWYPPIGPRIAATPNKDIGNISFSVSYNNTAYIYGNATGDKYIVSFSPNINNYTVQSNLANSTYNCYVSNTIPKTGILRHFSTGSYKTIDVTQSLCKVGNFAGITGPVYGVPNAFKYVENLGSAGLFLNLPTAIGAVLPSGGGSPPASSNDVANNGCTSNTPNSGSCYNPQTTLNNAVSKLNIGNNNNAAIAEYLESQINSTFIVPYSIAYTTSQTWNLKDKTEVFYNGGEGVGDGIDVPTLGLQCSENPLPSKPQVQTTVIDGFETFNRISSRVTENIEGGPTYLSYINLSTIFYQQNLSDGNLILPPYLRFKVLSDRLFGEIYINQSVAPGAPYIQMNNMLVINQSHVYNYKTVNHTIVSVLGGVAGIFKTVEAIPINPVPTNPSTVPDLSLLTYYYNKLFKLGGSHQLNFTYVINKTGATFPQLYSLYHKESYTYNLTLNMTYNDKVLGYNRLIYVFVDRYNNTIYLPLDVDLANITSFSVNNKTIINPNNPNETTVEISGSAGYYINQFSTTPIPLPDGSSIYLYYGRNMNYYTANVMNPLSYAIFAEQCAFGNSDMVDNQLCVLANPMNASQITSVSPQGVPYYNYKTFNTQYESGTSCANEPQSLLDQGIINSYYECNIYGNYGKPQVMMNLNGKIEYCVPNFANGTGTFTTQLGLIGIAKTTGGDFNYTFNTCGTGNAKVIAVYYGAPYPEPMKYEQSSLGTSMLPLNKAKLLTTEENTYSNSPNETLISFPIGSFVLSMGDMEVLLAVVIIVVLIVVNLHSRSRR